MVLPQGRRARVLRVWPILSPRRELTASPPVGHLPRAGCATTGGLESATRVHRRRQQEPRCWSNSAWLARCDCDAAHFGWTTRRSGVANSGVAALLLVERGSPVPVERLADEVWPTGPPRHWQSALRGLVSRVRSLLVDVGVDHDPITHVAGRYRLHLPDLVVDVEQAERHLHEARRLLDRQDVEGAQAAAGSARAISSRPVLPGVEARWVEGLRTTMAERHLDSLLLVAACRAHQGHVDTARSAAAQAVRLAPLREDAWRLAMRIEAEAGNTARALALYDECRHLLASELGTDPSGDTQELHTEILREVPVPDHAGLRRRLASRATTSALSQPVVAASRQDVAPFVGLRPFEVSDADRFFGREVTVQHLVDRVARERGVAVVGASGVGKSSVVRGGLLPALAAGAIPDSDTWPVVCMTPGPRPLRSLATAMLDTGAVLADARGDEVSLAPDRLVGALSDDPGCLVDLLRDRRPTVVVVDQAEELFTVADGGEAKALLSVLLGAARRQARRVVPVLTMRADFLDRAAQHTDLATFLSRSQYVLAPLAGDGLELAITGPSRRAGVELEPGLLGRLLIAAGHQPGSLPLLQHVLLGLWRARDGNILTVDAYQRLGGVDGALARHAEATWSALSDDERGVARRILLACVQPGGETADSSRPASVMELAGRADTERVEAVVAQLADARLMTTSRHEPGTTVTVELAHEALIAGWPRLRRWVDRQRAHLLTARRLESAADLWRANGRGEDWLLTGRRLDEALDLCRTIERGELDLRLAVDGRELVQASALAREAADRNRANRLVRERALRRRARTRLRVGAALTAADGNLQRAPELALLLALEVAEDVRRDVGELRPRWLRVLHHGLAGNHLVARLPDCGPLLAILGPDRIVTLDDAPDGDGRHLAVRDLRTGRILHRISALELARVPQAATDLEGSRLAVGDHSGRVTILDTASWDVVTTIHGPRARVGAVALSPGGRLVAGLWFESNTRRLLVHDARSASVLHDTGPSVARPYHQDFQADRRIDFSPSGTHLAAVTGPGHSNVELLDTADWRTVAVHRMVPRVHKIAFAPDGTRVGLSHDYGVCIHDPETLARLRGRHTTVMVPTMCWTANSDRLVVVGNHLQTLARDEPPLNARPTVADVTLRLDRHGLDRTVAAVPDTSHVLLGQRRGRELQRWDLAPARGTEVVRFVHGVHTGSGVAWSPSGARLAFATPGGWIEVRTTANWEVIDRFQVTNRRSRIGNEPGMENLEFTPDGRDIVAVGEAGTLMVWDTRTSEPRHTRRFPGAWTIGDSCPGRDGELIAAGAGPHLEIMDRSGTTIRVLDLPDDMALEAIALDPGGQMLAATVGRTGTAQNAVGGAIVWDVRTGDRVAALAMVAHNLSFHPHDGSLAVSSTDEAVIWNPRKDTIDHRLIGHSGWVQDVTHSPDGTCLVTAGWDGDLRIWDHATGRQLQHLTGPSPLSRVRFHPTRPWLAVSEALGTIHVMTLADDELVDIANGRVTRQLTPEERRLHLPEDTLGHDPIARD